MSRKKLKLFNYFLFFFNFLRLTLVGKAIFHDSSQEKLKLASNKLPA